MAKKSIRFPGLPLVCLSLLLAWWAVATHPGQSLEQVTYFRGHLQGYYGLDQQTGGALVFAQEAGKDHSLFLPYAQGDTRVMVEEIHRTPQGDIYAVLSHHQGSGLQASPELGLYRWELPQNKLTEVADLSGISGDFAGFFPEESTGLALLFFQENALVAYDLAATPVANLPLPSQAIQAWYPCAQGVLLQDQEGGLFFTTEAEVTEISQAELGDSLRHVNFMVYQDTIAFFNLDKQAYYQVLATPQGYQAQAVASLTQEIRSLPTFAQLSAPQYHQSLGGFYGWSQENGRQIPLFFGQDMERLETIPASARSQSGLFFLVFLASVGVLFLLKIALSQKTAKGQGIPLWWVVLALGVLWLFASGRWASDYLRTASQAKAIEGYARGITLFSSRLEAEFHQADPVQVWQTQTEEVIQQIKSQAPTNRVFPGRSGDSVVFYLVQEGQLYQMWGNSPAPTPIQYHLPYQRQQGLYGSLHQNSMVIDSFVDYGREELLVQPLYDPQGQLVALLEFALSVQESQHQLQEEYRTDTCVFLGYHLLMLLLILLVVWGNTRKLAQVHATIQGMLQGNLQARIPPLGMGEMGLLGKSFNQMCNQIQEKISYLQEFHHTCQGFFPPFLFSRLHPQGVLQTQPGDYAQLDGVVLQISLPEESHLTPLLDGLNPGATILELKPHRIKAYVQDPKQSVELALNLHQLSQPEHSGLHLLLSLERVGIALLGGRTFHHLALLSPTKTFGQEMSHRLATWQIPLAITGEALGLLGTTPPYQFRLLGYLLLYTGKQEPLYQLLEANSQEDMRRKLDTKALFEEGIALLMAGDVPLAMKRFIHVLGQDPQDKVAQWYLQQYQDGASSFYLLSDPHPGNKHLEEGRAWS